MSNSISRPLYVEGLRETASYITDLMFDVVLIVVSVVRSASSHSLSPHLYRTRGQVAV